MQRSHLRTIEAQVQVLAPAVPEVVRKRQERKAAYIESKKEASTWMPLVQANRQARTLRLTGNTEVPQVVSAAGLASKHTPTSDFELEIAELLKEAGHTDAQAVAKVCHML
jgi:U3 small nucleolar RNA-associated protein 14